MAVLLGQAGTGANSANSNLSGTGFATRLQCTTSGTVDSVWLRSGATVPSAAQAFWAIYADGAGVPAARLTASLTGTAGTANTYTSFPVTPGLAVTSGTFYWIAFLRVGGAWDYTDFATSGGDSSDDTVLASMPNPWAEASGFTNIINMRAEGTAASVPDVAGEPQVRWNQLGPSALFGPNPFIEDRGALGSPVAPAAVTPRFLGTLGAGT